MNTRAVCGFQGRVNPWTPARLTMQPPKSYSVGGQRSSRAATGKPAGARPDYRGRWCAGQYCDTCRAGDSDRAHPITNAIDGTERWWQSPPLSRSLEYNEVNVTLDLGQLFHVAYVLIKFANSPRPDLWVLERSINFGDTYQPWQYFACSSGDIVVSLVNGRPGAMNFSYSPVLRNFTKATNIRLRFLRTNTLLGHLMGKALRDPTVTRRYYYSIKDISIGGRCVCNGHAEACDAKDPTNPYRLQCDCQHNTCGVSCDQCCPGYNQMPWKPATTDNANECEPCNCNNHSFDCYYDPEVDRRKASVDINGRYLGGGFCMECQHHTTGINCERCIPGYYRSPDHPVDSPFACAACACDSEFTDGTCEDLTGRCYCKPNFTGENCASCAEGYTGFPVCYPVPTYPNMDNGELLPPAGSIINCECNAAGTEGNLCRPDPRNRICACKPNFEGVHCDQCIPRHFGLNCQPCQCSGPGVFDGGCNAETGQCFCRSGFQGYLCDQCAPGYFNYPLCQLCGCSTVGSVPEGCDPAGRCLCKPEFTGPRCEQCKSGFHSYPNCQVCSCDPRGSAGNGCSPAGHCQCRPNFTGPTCNQCAPGYYGYPSCTACQCSIEGSRHSSCNQETGQCNCLANVGGQHCDSCAHGAYGFPLCQVGSCNPDGSIQNGLSPSASSCNCRPYVQGAACDTCKPLYWNLTPDNPYGCTSCRCSTEGTISSVAECSQGNGQCFCKPNVCSRTCSVCKDGYNNLERTNFFGCQGCQCDIGGSIGLTCDDRTGRCQCRKNVEGLKCNQPKRNHYFPDLHHLKFEIEDGTMLDGRPVRFNYNPLEFEAFSWRGYAQMSSIQSKVRVAVHVKEAELYLFNFILRYVNSGDTVSYGKITAYQAKRQGSDQSKQIIFAPGSEPSFVTVPQNSFVEPFVLNPGTWSIIIEAQGILLCVGAAQWGQCQRVVTLQAAVSASQSLQDLAVSSANPAFTPTPIVKFAPVILVARQVMAAVQPVTANAGPTSLAQPVISVHLVTTDTPAAQHASAPSRALATVPVTRRLASATALLTWEVSTAIPAHTEPTASLSVKGNGQCFCKPNVCSRTCSVCKDGYNNLERTNFFGCQVLIVLFKLDQREYSALFLSVPQGCQCDIGGSIGLTCDDRTGRCQCRKNVEGLKCNQPKRNHYFPDLHHLKFEIEDGTMLDGRPVRFNYNPLEFEAFSWRGYAQMSSIQDFLVLLPSAYYEAPVLQLKVTEACKYKPSPEEAKKNCLLYKYLSLDGFLSAPGVDGTCRFNNHLPRRCQSETLTPRHPPMAICSGNDINVQLKITVPRPSGYVLVVEYANEDESSQTLSISVNTPGRQTQQESIILYSCKYSFLCRGVAVDSKNRVAVFGLTTEGDVQFIADRANFFLYKVYLIPHEEFTMEYVEPKMHCISTHGTFSPDSGACIHSRFQTPSQSTVLKDGLASLVPEAPLHSMESQVFSADRLEGSQQANATFCPHGFGCRSLMISENQIILDVTDNEVFITIKVPRGKTVWLDYVLVVPEASYSSNYLVEEPLDKSYDFISHCGANSFYINPTISTPFCRESAISLSVFYNNGALPCGCHEAGAVSTACDTFGGKCNCRPNVIGRDCSRCATGYWGFPNCRPCQCGTRLCNEVTGQCICPPRTVKPECTICEPQTFGCHPLVGCEECNCSRSGVSTLTDMGCNIENGQCKIRDISLLNYLEKLTQTAFLFSTQTVDMNGWVLLSGERQELAVSVSPERGLVEADLRDVPDVYQELHWHAPQSYHGDRVSSYGGFLRYRLHSQSLPIRGDVAPPPLESARPDVILKGNKMTLVYQDKSYPDPGQLHEGNIHLIEGNFRHAQTRNSVSREELMMVLVGLEVLQIRALHSQSSVSVSLERVVLEGASQATSGSAASNVEICMCPANYRGDSCQECAPGFYRDTKGLFLGKCVPCNCNGHSDECLPGSGICVNCQHNTEGNHCETCRNGFLGNSTAGQTQSCTGCPCPLQVSSNNFAIGCVERSSSMQCLCMPGYAGPKCERCAPGFYGNPMVIGSSCQPCQCNGNTDANMLFSDCDSLMGVCIGCMHNTAGPHCEICAPGYFGDAIIAKNCTNCNCSPCGTASCDPRTGQCQCKPGVTGARCDRSCDSCVVVLLDDLDSMKGLFPVIRDQLTNLNASSIAWGRLRGLDKSIESVTWSAMLTLPVVVCCSVLGRVDNNMAKRSKENDGLVDDIRDQLTKYNTELMDLRDALNEAVNQTAQVEDLNNRNENLLDESRKKNSDLQQALAEVKGLLTMAEDALFQVTDLLQMLEDSKEDYEKLAANLDGARKRLLEKVQKFASASTKIPLVEEAERHAELLHQLSKNLSSVIQDTNQDGFIQRAINASNAYSSIIEAVRNAENAAKKADEAATNALEVCLLSLGDTIPLLIKKLDKLQSRSTQMPNISENIERIRDLISQARNAASKVSVPMKFDGTSGVQLRNPNNLLDVAPYTSLKFYISLLEGKKKRQTESEKQFVFYLGNKDATKGFLGMSIEGKKLKWFFNVGGQTAELLNEQTISTDAFNMIKLERILQYGQMSVTVDKTTSLVTKGNTVAGGDEGLLKLTPSNTVFYVGGYPPDFLPPPELRLSKFQGCIEMDSLNEEVISLYNFEKNFMVDTVKNRPCGRKKSVTEPWINDGSYFDGSGFAAVEIQSSLPGTSRFEQEVKVLSYNGILFFLEGEGHFICIAVKDGDLKLYYDFNGELKEAPTPNTDLKISDAKSKGIQIILREPNGNMKVYVRLERKMAFNVEHSGSPLNFNSVYYIGGVPEEILPNKVRLYVDNILEGSSAGRRKRHPREVVLEKFYLGGAPDATLGSNLTGCISNMFVKRENDEQMVVDFLQSSLVQVSLNCPSSREPQQIRALVKKNKMRSKATLKASRNRIVERSCRSKQPKIISGAFQFSGLGTSRLEFNNVPESFRDRERSVSGFVGCIKNLKLDSKSLDPPSSTFGVGPCSESSLEDGVYFAAGGGHLTLDNSFAVSQDFEMMLEVRPVTDTGLLFHIGRKRHYLTLYAENGEVTVKVNNGGGEFSASVTPEQSLCNGRWHHIAVIKRNNVIQLDVDTEGKHAVGPTWPHSSSTKEMAYLGGVPDTVDLPGLSSPRPSFYGCVRNLIINQSPEHLSRAGFIYGAVGVGGCPVTVKVNNGGGEFSASVTPEQSLCNGRWHHIADTVDLPGLSSPRPSFYGCVRNLIINQSPEHLSRAGFIYGAVGVGGCPVM
ncbi:UNVERIFIED_CONTAM: hypothetical protein FKN15_045804 [Acipenser sinensis]